MTLDATRYVNEVLEPARKAGNKPPADLWVRYALSDAVVSGDLAGHIDAVYRLWQKHVKPRKYRELATALITEHVKLSGQLDAAALRRSREEGKKRAEARLQRRIEALKATATLITPDELAEMVSQSAVLNAAEIETALGSAGIHVVDPPDLPASPPTAKFVSLQRALNAAGVRHSFELLFGSGSFKVLKGFHTSTSSEAVTDVVRRLLKEQELLGTQGSTPTRDSLRILEEVAAAGQYAECLLCELVDALRRSISGAGFQRIVADEAIEMGLVAEEAPILALAILSAGAVVADPIGIVVDEIEELLAAGALRTAEQRALGLDRAADPRLDEIAGRVDAAAREVRRQIEAADAALAQGRREAAAELLSSVVRAAVDDDDLSRRLQLIAPPPPTDLRAIVVDGDVRLTWTASASRVGEVTYRVVRDRVAASSASSGSIVASVAASEAIDRGAPVAEDLHYSVFASRSDVAWSDAASAGPVVVTPELTNLRLDADARSVTGSWGVHPAVVDVVVVRRKDRAPSGMSDGQTVRGARLQGFTDTSVATGQTYYYRVSAVYTTPSGARRSTAGLVATARPERPAEIVTDLGVAVQVGHAEPSVELTWTEPGGGAVSVVRTDAAPTWTPGTMISVDELARLGQTIAAPGDGRAGERVTVNVAPTYGKSFFTVFSVTGTAALVGNTATITLVQPVRRPMAERLEGTVRLSWQWPDRSTSAKVRWWPADDDPSSATEVVCRRRTYEDEGGFSLDVGRGAVRMVIEASLDDPGGTVTAAPASVDVASLAAEVRYGVVRQRTRRQERARVRFTAATACRLPPVVVVHSAGRVMPLDASSGSVLTTLPATSLEPGVPHEVEFDVPRGKGPSWLVCFPQKDGQSDEIVLVPPPVRDLMVS